MTFGTDKATINNDMDSNLAKYDVGENISGAIDYEVDSKNKNDITLCIKKISCKPQKRMKGEY